MNSQTGLLCAECGILYPTTLSKANCGKCNNLMIDTVTLVSKDHLVVSNMTN